MLVDSLGLMRRKILGGSSAESLDDDVFALSETDPDKEILEFYLIFMID